MRPPESFISQPIRSLQTMLRAIAENDSSYMRTVPDGLYGPETVQAVTVFQRVHGLPVTGVTNQATWDTLVAVYELALIEQGHAQEIEIILNPKQVIRRGEKHPNLLLAQAMLTVLAEVYHSIGQPSNSGILDAPTADSLSSFQSLSALPMTGQLDKNTWKHLSHQYTLASNLQNLKEPTADKNIPPF